MPPAPQSQAPSTPSPLAVTDRMQSPTLVLPTETTLSDICAKPSLTLHNMLLQELTPESDNMMGDYTLGNWLGAGSMGELKLATHKITGEKFAIKIVPHPACPRPPVGDTSPEVLAKQATQDTTREIRTLREAALSRLVYHPHIWKMREMIIGQHQYCIVFEYIDGDPMLDYVIHHGRLGERVARKFARQIGSALDYCHRNNIIHRDLKLENIYVLKNGEIKISDFGLSNLYNPASHLSTFCGTSYFAAPELLEGKVYTGPEIDVWSFGVVLYVLICGRVPFDDESLPGLQAKIKRGLVEYPSWLSADCKHLLKHMLDTNPATRATLHKVINHPWMLRGFAGPADSHLSPRAPLRAEELDRQVIREMQGFEFGTEDEIKGKLAKILESEPYQRVVQAWDSKHVEEDVSGKSLSDSSLGISHKGEAGLGPGRQKSRHFSVFDFCRRKLFTPTSALPNCDDRREISDPTQGFHPLISMYFLAREKLEREHTSTSGCAVAPQLSIPKAMNASDSDVISASFASSPADGFDSLRPMPQTPNTTIPRRSHSMSQLIMTLGRRWSGPRSGKEVDDDQHNLVTEETLPAEHDKLCDDEKSVNCGHKRPGSASATFLRRFTRLLDGCDWNGGHEKSYGEKSY